MNIGSITYHLITDLGDYKIAHEFMRAQGWPDEPLSFPTILAIDEDGEVQAMLSTRLQNDMIVAGPFVIGGERLRPWLVIRMIDAYDYVMREMGVKTYIYDVEETNKTYLRIIKRVYGHEPYATRDGTHFFIKRLDGSSPEERVH